jgi:hypothetical protein
MSNFSSNGSAIPKDMTETSRQTMYAKMNVTYYMVFDGITLKD